MCLILIAIQRLLSRKPYARIESSASGNAIIRIEGRLRVRRGRSDLFWQTEISLLGAGFLVRNMSIRLFVKSSESVAAEVVEAGTGTKLQVLINDEEGPNFALRRFIMEPGGGIPEHTNAEEH